jgi:hypothetical protein
LIGAALNDETIAGAAAHAADGIEINGDLFASGRLPETFGSGLYPARDFRGNEVSAARVSGLGHPDPIRSRGMVPTPPAHFMKIDGTHEIKAPREVVYQAITDPQILQRCIPGCQSLEKTEENTYIRHDESRSGFG